MAAAPHDPFDVAFLRTWLQAHSRELSGRRPLLVSVSGGLDSMVLWHLIAGTGLPHEVLHVNFGLRGEDSRRDANAVIEIAARRGVGLHLEYAALDKTRAGVQAAAREVRRGHTTRLLERRSAAVLAHHADDQAETVLMRLTRGTGPRGLVGMEAVRGPYLRPLLEVPKSSLEAFAKTHDIDFREDASNATDAYVRNRFRHHVLPVLTDIEPRAVGGICLSAKRQAALLTFAEGRSAEVLARARQSDPPTTPPSPEPSGADATMSGRANLDDQTLGTYARDELAQIRGLGVALQFWLEPRGFRSAAVDDIEAWIADGEPQQRTCLNSDRTLVCTVAGRRVRLDHYAA